MVVWKCFEGRSNVYLSFCFIMERSTMKSFAYAARGFRYALRGEQNFQLEMLAAAVAIFGMYAFDVSSGERVALVLSIAVVLSLELVNTAVERMMDMLKPRVHPYVRVIKDVMAAAVLVASLGALAIGLIIFLPRVLEWFR